ncbi:class I SAM-dependent methyltransferase [Candidatus Thioglobus sp.]|nr:class I SAM-dependent methyltransferase [Candidatus Thioglobus sp.]
MKNSNSFTNVTDCKLCKSSDQIKVLALSPVPIGDRYLPESEKSIVLEEFPMDIMMCKSCGHYQNSGFVNPELIYSHYLSRPATTNPVLSDAYKGYVSDLLKLTKKSELFAVEAGSNDGAFVSYLQENGIKVLGVEPSLNLSKQANDRGIPTLNDYFSFNVSKEIKKDYGEADFFVANHTFSNIIDNNDFVNGVKNLLAPSGVFSMQTHYHLSVIEKNLVENFTHEHLSGYYVKPLVSFFSSHELELFDVEVVPAKEGSIRCFIQHKGGPNKLQKSVSDTIAYEDSIGMDRVDRHVSITSFMEKIKTRLHDLLDSEVEKGKTVAGFGTSIGATTFSYNYDLGNLISFFVDDDKYRHNLISPGLQIPVLPSKMIYERNVDYVIIMAPLYAEAIMKNNQEYLEQGGTFIKIWPEFEVINNA